MPPTRLNKKGWPQKHGASEKGCHGGVDTHKVGTHKDFHVAVALDHLGRRLGTEQLPTTAAGYRKLLAWLRHFGRLDAVDMEGTGSWGLAWPATWPPRA